MPAEPVTTTERSIIPREILTCLVAMCFVFTVVCVIIAGCGWEAGTLKNQLGSAGFQQNRFTQDYVRFVLSVFPFVPFIMIFAAAWNSFRIAVFALGIFTFWVGMSLDLNRAVNVGREQDFKGSGTHMGARMLEAGLIIGTFWSFISLLCISPRDTTRWWKRQAADPRTRAVTSTNPAIVQNPVVPARRHGPYYIVHYVITSLAWIVTLAGCSTMLETIRRDYKDFNPAGHQIEGIQILMFLWYILIAVAFIGSSTALLCDSDLYSGFALACCTFTIIFALRFDVDITNYHFSDGHRRSRTEAGLSLIFIGCLLSSAGIMSRRTNVNLDAQLPASLNAPAVNPALP